MWSSQKRAKMQIGMCEISIMKFSSKDDKMYKNMECKKKDDIFSKKILNWNSPDCLKNYIKMEIVQSVCVILKFI